MPITSFDDESRSYRTPTAAGGRKPSGNDGGTIAYDTRLQVFTLSTGLLRAARLRVRRARPGGAGLLTGGPASIEPGGRPRTTVQPTHSLRPSRVHQSPWRGALCAPCHGIRRSSSETHRTRLPGKTTLRSLLVAVGRASLFVRSCRSSYVGK